MKSMVNCSIRLAVNTIDSLVGDPTNGLPEDVFRLASRITPMVNVDLLIKDESRRTLLSWRDDGPWKAGWHVPGGIIRYKETLADRIRAVARQELGAEVKFQETPLAMNEVIHAARKERGHFISFLYLCSLVTPPFEKLQYRSGRPIRNQWMWHDSCPENIIDVHEIYRRYM